MTRPIEVQAALIADLTARLELANERIFYLVGELADANARLGNTEYTTMPPKK